jgi:hypothetical protein
VWDLFVQTMDIEKENDYEFDPLDATKTWPEDQFPLRPVGKMVLDRNVDNWFTDNEMVSSCQNLLPLRAPPSILGQYIRGTSHHTPLACCSCHGNQESHWVPAVAVGVQPWHHCSRCVSHRPLSTHLLERFCSHLHDACKFDTLLQHCCASVSPLPCLTISVFAAGIMPSDDKLLQGRVFSYSDTQRYRLGANYQNLPINR